MATGAQAEIPLIGNARVMVGVDRVVQICQISLRFVHLNMRVDVRQLGKPSCIAS